MLNRPSDEVGSNINPHLKLSQILKNSIPISPSFIDQSLSAEKKSSKSSLEIFQEGAENLGIVKVKGKELKYDSKGVNWVFTWNNIPESKWSNLILYLENFEFKKRGSNVPLALFDFAMYQIEKGENGTIHAQGCFHLTHPTHYSFLMNKVAEPYDMKWWVEPLYKNSTLEKAANYCDKHFTHIEGPYTFGMIKGQGYRSDLDIGEEIIQNGISREIKKSSTYMKYSGWCHDMKRLGIVERSDAYYKEWFEKNALYPFQKDAVEFVLNQNDRQLLWVYGPKGSDGKSKIGLYLKLFHNAMFCTNGASRNIMTAYDFEPIIAIDIARTDEEHVNYKLIESLKNGHIFKEKYQSTFTQVIDPKVVVFSNNRPKLSALTLNRWVVMIIDPDLGTYSIIDYSEEELPRGVLVEDPSIQIYKNKLKLKNDLKKSTTK